MKNKNIKFTIYENNNKVLKTTYCFYDDNIFINELCSQIKRNFLIDDIIRKKSLFRYKIFIKSKKSINLNYLKRIIETISYELTK